ncbi:GGDEF domain-containing protein [Candidatus Mycobacterium wuenschmannii]|uniref:GGDEF domain-containing protein n=1 Tax=Candidatus Mycobacterium wuenschmannii TaxID=3027808 RepID=A0ABY8VY65_9MYCO|nr:GGDEF domain-containing protein [Candidatus Mycobacterium wuenschmannii]WIM88579.1 GGDEF domain-containing protein [Candidatus Mycobacterium wuenschmannii]
MSWHRRLRGPSNPTAEQYLTQRDKLEILSKLVMRETTYRYSIAAFVVVFALIGVLILFSHDGPRTLPERVVAWGFYASTIPVGVAMMRVNHTTIWWSHHTGYRHAPELFVFYADVGLTSVLLTLQNGMVAGFGAMLFAIIGTYVAHFVTPTARLIHVVFTSCVIIGLGWWALDYGDLDVPAVITAVLIGLFVVNGTVALHSIYTTEVRRAIASKHTHANTDPLTGIANRRAFNTRARDLIEASEDGVDVMLIDIDNFKTANDTHGHDRGDEILVDVALAILTAVDSTAVVARLGGDEFAVAAHPVDGRHYSAKTLRDRVVEQTGILVSVGWAATEPGTTDSSDALSAAVAAADIDLYAAKSARKMVAD